MAEERKLVSVLFADVVGSTTLGEENDPEVVRDVLTRYFDRVRQIVDAHGGSVEKFIGDAAMAVFGVPRLHDDDAERAVRAGLAIRDAMAELNADSAVQLEARIGINTGEAVASVEEREQRMVTGDVVNVAARLQQGADPGEVVVGALTEQLTRGAIEYEPHEPMQARGKSQPLIAFRALGARSEMPEQARGLPHMRVRLVGRAAELSLLVESFERARRDRRAQLFTVIGSAGVGKSRLVAEFLAKAAAPGDVHVLRGRCLPYGTGVTYWPLLELLQADIGVGTGMSRGEVLARLDERLAGLFPSEADRAAVRSRLGVVLGLTDVAEALPDVEAARLPAELAWGLARHVEVIAAERPVIAVIDDLQWAEPQVVEVVQGLLHRSGDIPLFLVCIGRPELLERHPGWGTGQANATLIALEPLTEDETRTLIGRLLDIDELPEALRTTIVRRAAGNPLFCEEFVRMLIDEGRLVREADRWRAASAESLDVRVPESIQALLAARLDALSAERKRLVQTASVIGEQFERLQLEMLSGGSGLEDELRELSRAGFVAPDRAGGPEAYRFRHILIRDVAYASLPKAERARLHDAFGRELEAAAADRRDELTEILAHHAERAYTLGVEVRLANDELAERGRRALELAFAAADRAFEREHRAALATFIQTGQAVEREVGPLTAADAARLRLMEARAEVLVPNYPVARRLLEETAEAALAAERPDLAAQAYLALASALVYSAGTEDSPLFDDAVAKATRFFDEAGNVRSRLEAQLLLLESLFEIGRLTEVMRAGRAMVEEAEDAGEHAIAARILTRLANVAGWLGQLELAYELADRADALVSRLGLAATARRLRFYRTRLSWVEDRLEKAEPMARSLVVEFAEAGDGLMLVAAYRILGEIHFERGRLEEADEAWRAALDLSVRFGERWNRTELNAFRAQVAVRRGDLDQAERLVEAARTALRDEDVGAVCVYHFALGDLYAAKGLDAEAEDAYRTALGAIGATEYWWWHILAIEVAEFLVSRGRLDEASALVEEIEPFYRAGAALRRARFEQLRATLAQHSAARER